MAFEAWTTNVFVGIAVVLFIVIGGSASIVGMVVHVFVTLRARDLSTAALVIATCLSAWLALLGGWILYDAYLAGRGAIWCTRKVRPASWRAP
jgi:hypothetical protein